MIKSRTLIPTSGVLVPTDDTNGWLPSAEFSVYLGASLYYFPGCNGSDNYGGMSYVAYRYNQEICQGSKGLIGTNLLRMTLVAFASACFKLPAGSSADVCITCPAAFDYVVRGSENGKYGYLVAQYCNAAAHLSAIRLHLLGKSEKFGNRYQRAQALAHEGMYGVIEADTGYKWEDLVSDYLDADDKRTCFDRIR